MSLLPTFDQLTPNRRLLVLGILLLPLIVLALFLYWQISSNRTSEETTETTSSNTLPLKRAPSNDLGFNFSHIDFWEVTRIKADNLGKSEKATTYQFQYSAPGLVGWVYEMTVYAYPSSNFQTLAQTLAGSDVKTSACEKTANCLVLEDEKSPVQAVVSGSNYTYAIKLYDAKNKKVLSAKKLVGPFPEVFQTFQAE